MAEGTLISSGEKQMKCRSGIGYKMKVLYVLLAAPVFILAVFVGTVISAIFLNGVEF